MASILEGELAEIIADALIDADVPYAVTVTRTVQGEYDPETGTYPTVVTPYACKGFVESYSEALRASGIVGPSDIKVVVLAPTLSITPAPATDTVTARGETYTIISVAPDPALATIELQARG